MHPVRRRHGRRAARRPACGVCAEGTYSNADRTACVPCLPGTYAPGRGNGFCLPCEAGTFQPSSNSPSCQPCGDVPPSYSLPGATRCEVCHNGAYCTQGIFYGSKAGWWAYRPLDLNSSTDGGAKTIVSGVELYSECKPINGFNSSRCEGGSQSTCKDGHWGALCSLCEPYHYKGRTECLPCDTAGLNATGDRKFLGFVTISIKAYNAETHRVAYELHFFMAICASIVVVIASCCMWSATRDPEEVAIKKKSKAAVKAALIAGPAAAMKRMSPTKRRQKAKIEDPAPAEAPPSPPSSPDPRAPPPPLDCVRDYLLGWPGSKGRWWSAKRRRHSGMAMSKRLFPRG